MLARQMLAATATARPQAALCDHAARTDITLVGADRSYLPITRFSIEQSDGVTAISQYLQRATRWRNSRSRNHIEVIPNFVNCDMYHRDPEAMRASALNTPSPTSAAGASLEFPSGEARADVIEIFDRVQKKFLRGC